MGAVDLNVAVRADQQQPRSGEISRKVREQLQGAAPECAVKLTASPWGLARSSVSGKAAANSSA